MGGHRRNSLPGVETVWPIRSPDAQRGGTIVSLVARGPRKEPIMSGWRGIVGLALVTAFTVATPSVAMAEPTTGCADVCSVGAAGTGGEASDGKAQGFRLEGPTNPTGSFPGSYFTNTGSQIGGHITISGAFEGTASGAFTPQGEIVGHYTGVLECFGGRC